MIKRYRVKCNRAECEPDDWDCECNSTENHAEDDEGAWVRSSDAAHVESERDLAYALLDQSGPERDRLLARVAELEAALGDD